MDDERPADRLLSPDGSSGWFAFNRDGSRIADDAEPWQAPDHGATIRLMGEFSVDVPLWEEGGLLFSDADELRSNLGVSDDLVADLVAWADAWQSRSDEAQLDAEAAALVRRLTEETRHRYQFVYKP